MITDIPYFIVYLATAFIGGMITNELFNHHKYLPKFGATLRVKQPVSDELVEKINSLNKELGELIETMRKKI